MNKRIIKILLYSFWIFIFLILYINIADGQIWIYTSRNYTIWTNQSGWYDFMGVSIIPNYDFIGCKLYKYGTKETPTKCYLKNLNNGTLDGTSFIGDSCQVSNNLTKGNKYWIGYSNDGSGTYTRAFADLSTGSPVGNMPFNSTLFYMSNSVQCHVGTCTNLTAFYMGAYSFNCSIACTPIWINATPTNWQNMTAYNCTIQDLIQQNRSYQRYDNACNQTNLTAWEFKNNSCSYCNSINSTLSICNIGGNSTILNEIEREKKMIAYVILAGIFLLLGVFVNYLFWLLASGVFGVLGLTTFISGATFGNNYQFIFYILMFFLFAVLGIIAYFGQSDKGKKKDMYDNFY